MKKQSESKAFLFSLQGISGVLFLAFSYFTFNYFSGLTFTLFTGSLIPVYIALIGLFFALVNLKTKSKAISPILLFSSCLLISWAFLNYTDSRVIFSDDHPSFLYRFQLLKDNFPYIPFYNPEWNAGYSAREFFPSGMLNAYILSSPLLYWGPDLRSLSGLLTYNYILLWLYVFIVPLAAFFSLKTLGFSQKASLIAGFLAFAPSLSFFEWLLKYGTLGFVLSAAFVPLTFSAIYNLVFKDKSPGFKDVLLLLVVSFFAISWSLIGFIFLPLVILALFKIIVKKDLPRFKFILLFSALFLAVNGPWIKIFIEESKVFSFLSGSVLPGSEEAVSPAQGSVLKDAFIAKSTHSLIILRNNFNKINPILLLCFFPGLFLLRRNIWLPLTFISCSVWIVLMAFLGDIYKPQLELVRLTLPLSFLMIIPAALFLERLTKTFEEGYSLNSNISPVYFILTGLTLGCVFINPFIAASAWSNKSEEKFTLQPKEFEELLASIKKFSGPGRTFFLGFVLHELGSTYGISQDGGHIAPLSYLSKRPLYSSDFYHTKWSTVDPIPKSFRTRGGEGIEEFLDLTAVTSVISAKKEWWKFLDAAPNYKQVYIGERFRMYSRQSLSPGYFLKGEGKVEHKHNGILVFPKTQKSTLKFRHLPKLKAYSKQAKINPVFAFKEETGKKKLEDVYYIELEVPGELIESGEGVFLGY